ADKSARRCCGRRHRRARDRRAAFEAEPPRLTETTTMEDAEQLGWTLDRHIFERQRKISGATGEFTALLQAIATAGRMIAARVHKAGLADVLGRVGQTNVQGEDVQKLDVIANQILIRCVEAGGHVCVMASEENED